MKKKCEVCGNRFESTREAQAFCSKACKQKKYRQSKQDPITPKADQDTLGVSYSEYENFLDFMQRDSAEIPLILFCFLKSKISPEVKGERANTIMCQIWDDLGETGRIIGSEHYRDFKDKFLSKPYKISS